MDNTENKQDQEQENKHNTIRYNTIDDHVQHQE